MQPSNEHDMLTLFDNFEREFQYPALHSESEFSFLNRSARLAAERVRRLLETWFKEYPATEQQTLRSRFRFEFQSAFYELLLHAFLKSLQCSVEVHPDVATDKRTKPDFLATFSDGKECFIEARVITDVSKSEVSKQNRLNRLYDQLDRLESPYFFLGLKNVKEEGSHQPSAKKFRQTIENWISTLDPDEVTNVIDEFGPSATPSLRLREGGFKITVFVIPKKPDARGKLGVRPLGMFPFKSRWGGSAPTFRGSLSKKTGRYGKVKKPYIIAANCISPWGLSLTDIVEALFGTKDLYDLSDESKTTFRPESDGVWYGPKGVKNTRVSAVLISTIYPWNLPRAETFLFHNPFAEFPSRHDGWQIRQVTVTEGRIEWTEGSTVGELLKIPPDWPGHLFND
jgi:hypothetical protein